MRILKDKVAVVTGAGSGIGRELALACAGEGMRLALADIEDSGLQTTLAALGGASDSILSAKCDVSKAAEVDRLADATYRRFGAAHLLFNNAGVAVLGPAWTAALSEWEWVLSVNVMGVVHGLHSFLPRMLAQGDPGHVVNTASVAGLVTVPGHSVYCASKHAVVALSECLLHDLRREKAAIGVSVLCPAFTNTGIFDSDRHRPDGRASINPHPSTARYAERERQALLSGRLTAADVARIAVEAVKAERFYVLTHPKIKGSIEGRLRDLIDERDPADFLPA